MFESAISAPCKGCAERAVGCQAVCSRYAAYRQKREALLAATFRQKETEVAIFHLRNDRIRRK